MISRRKIAGLFFVLLVVTTITAPLALTPRKTSADFNGIFAAGVGGLAGCAVGSLVGQLISQILSRLAQRLESINSVPTADSPTQKNTLKSAAELKKTTTKEYILDCVAWTINNIVIEQMTDAMLAWIRGGFHGNPTFATDYKQTFVDAADAAAAQFINDPSLNFLCSPFQLQIKIGLITRIRNDWRSKISCNLSGIVKNVDEFFNGDFSQGGWPGWFRVTTQPQNNPYGAFMIAQAELDQRMANAIGLKQNDLLQGKGFFSQTKCVEYAPLTEGQEGPPECTREEVVTPGSVVETQLNEQLNLPRGRLQVAKQLNEVLSAFFSQLILSLLSNDNGLLGDTSSIPRTPTTIPDLTDLIPPDDEIGGGQSCSAGVVLDSSGTPGAPVDITRNGTFFTATAQNPHLEISIPMDANRTYKRAVVDLDFTVGEWYSGNTDGDHQIFSLHRSEGTGAGQKFKWGENALGYISAAGPDKNLFRSGQSFNIDFNCAALKNRRTTVTLQEGQTYHVRYVYDTVSNTITTTLRAGNANGGVLASMNDTPTANVISSTHPQADGRAGNGFFIGFGNANASGNDVPSLGWHYANLHVVFEQ